MKYLYHIRFPHCIYYINNKTEIWIYRLINDPCNSHKTRGTTNNTSFRYNEIKDSFTNYNLKTIINTHNKYDIPKDILKDMLMDLYHSIS